MSEIMNRSVAKKASDREVDILRRRLHDTTLQTLEYIANAGTIGGQADFERLMRLAAREATELRYLLEGVVEDEPRTLAETLECIVRDAQTYADHRIELAIGPTDGSLDRVTVVELGGAVREALTNVRKHAYASHATVYAEEGDDSALITIRDDGRGADLDQVSSGLGLAHSIKGRCQRLGGEAEVASTPGAGFRVTLRLGRPIPSGGAPPASNGVRPGVRSPSPELSCVD